MSQKTKTANLQSFLNPAHLVSWHYAVFLSFKKAQVSSHLENIETHRAKFGQEVFRDF